MSSLGEFIDFSQHLEILSLGNNITDRGVESLKEYLIGNIYLKILHLNSNKLITDASVEHLLELATKSCITCMDVTYTSVSQENLIRIDDMFKTPIDEREIPITSNSKSAAKSTGL